MPQDLARQAAEQKIAYFLISFVDLFGTMRAKLVPAAAIEAMQRDGAAFAGFATHLDLTPADPDIFAVPDAATLTILPWQPDIGWVMADVMFEGAPLEQMPRQVLQRQVAAAGAQGYRLKTGVEAEFFVISGDGATIADSADRIFSKVEVESEFPGGIPSWIGSIGDRIGGEDPSPRPRVDVANAAS